MTHTRTQEITTPLDKSIRSFELMKKTDRDQLTEDRNLLFKFAKYFVVGGLAALTEWLLFVVIVYFVHWHYIPAAIISFVIATGVNYALSLIIVFKRGRHSLHREVLLVYMASGIGLMINVAVLALLVKSANGHLIAAKIGATGVAFIWNFISRHLWIF